MGPKKCGFTVIELLTVLAIIAILVGIFIPTVGYVRNTASEARQKVQLAAIDMALSAFKGDYGDYPPSTLNISLGTGKYYCGAQELCEALLGLDLLGFEPNSMWDGSNKPYQNCTSPPCDLQGRLGPYLESGSANAFTLRQLFGGSTSTNLNLDRYVLCDSFGAKPVTIAGKTVKAGRPILYYKANVASKDFSTPTVSADAANRIYNYTDNIDLIDLKRRSENTSDPLYGLDPSSSSTLNGTFLYSLYSPPNVLGYKLRDPKITYPWPYRPDSYILISAGVDGLYGTQDDICNF